MSISSTAGAGQGYASPVLAGSTTEAGMGSGCEKSAWAVVGDWLDDVIEALAFPPHLNDILENKHADCRHPIE